MNADLTKADRDPKSCTIVGAAMAVHREPGRGFLGAVYQEAPAIDPATHDIPFKRQVEQPVRRKGQSPEATGMTVGLLVNIGAPGLGRRRLAFTPRGNLRQSGKSADNSMTVGPLVNIGASGLGCRGLAFTPRGNLRQSAESADNTL